MQLSPRKAGERQAVGGRQLAGDRLDLGDLLRGENGAGAPRAACPASPANRSSPNLRRHLPTHSGVQSSRSRDLGVALAARRVEDHPRPLDLAKRLRLGTSDPLELFTLLVAQFDPDLPRHRPRILRSGPDPSRSTRTYFGTGLLAGQRRHQAVPQLRHRQPPREHRHDHEQRQQPGSLRKLLHDGRGREQARLAGAAGPVRTPQPRRRARVATLRHEGQLGSPRLDRN